MNHCIYCGEAVPNEEKARIERAISGFISVGQVDRVKLELESELERDADVDDLCSKCLVLLMAGGV